MITNVHRQEKGRWGCELFTIRNITYLKDLKQKKQDSMREKPEGHFRTGWDQEGQTQAGQKLRPWYPLISHCTILQSNQINHSWPSSSSFSFWPPALWGCSSHCCWSLQPGTECFQWSFDDLLAFLSTRRKENGVSIMCTFSLPVIKHIQSQWETAACSIPWNARSWLLSAPWIISCASVFLTFKMSMVSFSSVSSESSRGKRKRKIMLVVEN